jgi:hypothetical protein
MFVKRLKEDFQRPRAEPLEVRKKRAAIEGSQALADYRRAQEAARERLIALREERLARERAQEQP